MNEHYSNAKVHSYIKAGCVNVFKGEGGKKKGRKDGKNKERMERRKDLKEE